MVDQLTGDTSVGDFQELLIATWVTKESSIDGNGTLLTSRACAIQEKMNIDVTVASKRDLTKSSNKSVVTSVPSCLEHDNLLLRTDDLKDCVETSVFFYQLETCDVNRFTCT